VRSYVGDELLWDVQLILKRQSVPQTQLGQQGQLGWTSFLTSRAPAADSDAAVFTPAF
jgi:type VI secretion system protein ImpH